MSLETFYLKCPIRWPWPPDRPSNSCSLNFSFCYIPFSGRPFVRSVFPSAANEVRPRLHHSRGSNEAIYWRAGDAVSQFCRGFYSCFPILQIHTVVWVGLFNAPRTNPALLCCDQANNVISASPFPPQHACTYKHCVVCTLSLSLSLSLSLCMPYDAMA